MSAPARITETLSVFPDRTSITDDGLLMVGGVSLVALARDYGTPLYVFDEAGLRSRARAYRDALEQSYPGPSTVCYAAKAYGAPWLLRAFADEGLGLDIVSGGELHAALAAGVRSDRLYLHGNNKREDELVAALEGGVGRIVVDNLAEISTLDRIASNLSRRQAIMLRIGPGVDVRTHAHLQTGGPGSKFGLSITSGEAAEGVRVALAAPSLDLRGLHVHLGSQITEVGPFLVALDGILRFAERMSEETGFELRELSPGGGFAVRYRPEDPPVDWTAMARQIG